MHLIPSSCTPKKGQNLELVQPGVVPTTADGGRGREPVAERFVSVARSPPARRAGAHRGDTLVPRSPAAPQPRSPAAPQPRSPAAPQPRSPAAQLRPRPALRPRSARASALFQDGRRRLCDRPGHVGAVAQGVAAAPAAIVPSRAPSRGGGRPVSRSPSGHGDGQGRGARGRGGAWRRVGAAAAAALSAMRRGSGDREPAAGREAERVGLDAGAAGEPEREAPEEPREERAPGRPRAAREGDASAVPPPPQPARARGLRLHREAAGKGRGCGRSSGNPADELRPPRPVTVDSSKARTSLGALKISIRQLRWKEFPFGRRLPCDIYWHGVSFHDNDIFSGQVNKFPGMTEMVRKITLSRAVRIMQNLFPEEYNFYPRSWILPDEFQLFVAQVRMVKDGDPSWKPTFIVKPDGGCQGDGIYLIKDPSDIRLAGTLQSRPAVVQEYICKPLLIDKLKFDIRLYVLLKSLDPLEIYIAKDGLSRFCTEPYQEPSPKNLHHVFMHLTNYSLNIHSGNFVHSDSTSTGSKRTFSSILCRLSSKGVDIKKVWSDIISLVIKTVIALTPELKVFYQSDIPAGRPGPTCFQLSPGVFENVPSLVDEEVKVAVIRDTLRLMDPLKNKREKQNCKLSSSSLSMAAVDILYIDITRRWNSMTLDQRDSGMCLQAFVEAFFYLAQRKFKMLPLHEQVASLVDLCEYHLSLLDERRLVCGRSSRAGGRAPGSSTPQGATRSAEQADGHPPCCTDSARKSSGPRRALS
uniref:Tubulin tyrosine ligase like 11 n=1 Tax=Canis lupus familiaris TaxID=9615 RepID=A0A8C0LZB9_CANLF